MFLPVIFLIFRFFLNRGPIFSSLILKIRLSLSNTPRPFFIYKDPFSSLFTANDIPGGENLPFYLRGFHIRPGRMGIAEGHL